MEKLVIIFTSILIGTLATTTDTVTSNDSTGENASQDRINININRGHAAVHGAGGGSVSDSVSQGVLVGIRRPGFQDQTLYDKSESYSNAQAYGHAPPTAWTSAQNQIENGVNRGGATAGFSGGAGIAQTDSISHTVEIPLDNYGTVMFSNLNEKPHEAHAHDLQKPTAEIQKPALEILKPTPEIHKPKESHKRPMNFRPEI